MKDRGGAANPSHGPTQYFDVTSPFPEGVRDCARSAEEEPLGLTVNLDPQLGVFVRERRPSNIKLNR
jgi:hypothetical protein